MAEWCWIRRTMQDEIEEVRWHGKIIFVYLLLFFLTWSLGKFYHRINMILFAFQKGYSGNYMWDESNKAKVEAQRPEKEATAEIQIRVAVVKVLAVEMPKCCWCEIYF